MYRCVASLHAQLWFCDSFTLNVMINKLAFIIILALYIHKLIWFYGNEYQLSAGSTISV